MRIVPPSLSMYLIALMASFILYIFFFLSQTANDCQLVNISFGRRKCLQQNNLFLPSTIRLCRLSQFFDVHCARREARVCRAVSTTSAAEAEMLQSKQNQAAQYSLLGLSVTSKGSLQSPSRLAENYWVQGKDKFQESLWISE